MNRTTKAVSVAAVLMCLAGTGCTDPTVAPKSTVTSANIFNDPNSYRAFIAKIYGGLIVTGQRGPDGNPDIGGIDEGFGEYLRLYWYLQEMPTDEAVIGWNDPGLRDLNVGGWGQGNEMVNAMYYRVYYQIMLANEFLRQSTDAKLAERGQTDPTLITNVHFYRAEARFLRALSYWHGIDLFGNIPLVTEADPLGVPPKQTARDSVYRFVVTELNAIAGLLPPKTTSTYGRATPAAAHMLLAKLYLNAAVYTGTPNYTGAVTEAQAVISAGYTLDTSFTHNFQADNNTSPELIFVAVQDGGNTQTWGGMTFLIHAGCGGSMSSSNYGIDYCWGGYRMKQQAYRLFAAGDGRASYFWTAGQTDSVIDIGNFSNGIAAPKFTNKTSAGGGGAQLGMVDTDFPIFRLADAYLIYVEGNIRGGGGSAATALGYLNAIRQRAYGDTTANFAALPPVDTVLAERGREMLFEAQRRTDLVRFGLFSTGTYLWAWKNGVPGGAALATGRDLYPLPANELVANPNLQQNPGY
jgi:starch-binding outer membrane protein, SusD/RagB family